MTTRWNCRRPADKSQVGRALQLELRQVSLSPSHSIPQQNWPGNEQTFFAQQGNEW